ncbi:MAG: outer membrane beta-barrel protein [Alloprevotella sp.]|nr:outer membrane beta-barrel protein [Alloprevotella sp.]
MKKTFLSLIAVLLCANAWAQYSSQNSGGFSFSEDRLYYGIRIGVTGSYIKADAPMLDVAHMKAGFTFGGVVGLRLSDSTPVYLESGLYYKNRGGKRTKDFKIKTSINSLEIPILIKYGVGLPNDMALLPFAGAFVDGGMGRGHYRNYTTMDHGRAISKHRYQRFDAGIKVGCGFEYKMLYAELGYDFGLANMVHESADYESGHSGGIFANFGVNF